MGSRCTIIKKNLKKGFFSCPVLRGIIGYFVDFLQAIIYYVNITDSLFCAIRTLSYFIVTSCCTAGWTHPKRTGLLSCPSSPTADHPVPGSASLLWETPEILPLLQGTPRLEGGTAALHQGVSVQGEKTGFEAHLPHT